MSDVVSGREDLTPAERADLLAAEMEQMKASTPRGYGHDVHEFNVLLGGMQAVIRALREAPPNRSGWGWINASRTELRVMAWRRGGIDLLDAETARLYPRRR